MVEGVYVFRGDDGGAGVHVFRQRAHACGSPVFEHFDAAVVETVGHFQSEVCHGVGSLGEGCLDVSALDELEGCVVAVHRDDLHAAFLVGIAYGYRCACSA